MDLVQYRVVQNTIQKCTIIRATNMTTQQMRHLQQIHGLSTMKLETDFNKEFILETQQLDKIIFFATI